MLLVFLSLTVIATVLVIVEFLWRRRILHGEYARKAVHITAGSFIAFWPFYMSFMTIRGLALAMLLVIAISRRAQLFKSIHKVKRSTTGDIWFPLAIGLAALLTNSPWVFVAAILHLSLADGFAAVIGQKFGKSNQYKVLGGVKSYIGTTTFLIISVMITGSVLTLGFSHFGSISWPILIWLPLIATALENLGTKGSDNILVSLFVILALITQSPMV